MATGRLLTQADEDHAANVCVIGMDVVSKLMPGVDPLGKEIRAGQGQYQIVGVAKPKGTVLGQPQDNFVMIPLRTYRSVWLQKGDSVTMFVQARGPEWMSAAEDEARVIIRTRRHLRYEEDDNFASDHAGLDYGNLEPDHGKRIWNRDLGHLRVSGCGRNRDHEHHAGERDGADARNRIAQIAGSAPRADRDAIPGGIIDAGDVGRGRSA